MRLLVQKLISINIVLRPPPPQLPTLLLLPFLCRLLPPFLPVLLLLIPPRFFQLLLAHHALHLLQIAHVIDQLAHAVHLGPLGLAVGDVHDALGVEYMASGRPETQSLVSPEHEYNRSSKT